MNLKVTFAVKVTFLLAIVTFILLTLKNNYNRSKVLSRVFLDSLRSKKSPQPQILMYMPWIRSYDIHYILFLLLVDNIQLLHWKASHQIPGVHSEFITHVKLWTKITDIHNNACISRQLHFDTLKLGTIAKERHLCWTPSNSIELFGYWETFDCDLYYSGHVWWKHCKSFKTF